MCNNSETDALKTHLFTSQDDIAHCRRDLSVAIGDNFNRIICGVETADGAQDLEEPHKLFYNKQTEEVMMALCLS